MHEELPGKALACGLAAGMLLSAGAPREALAAAATASQGDLLEEYLAKAQATGSASRPLESSCRALHGRLSCVQHGRSQLCCDQ